MTKVFCKGCRFLINVDHDMGNVYWCKHPDNLILVETAIERYTTYACAKDRNSNNDCRLKKEKILGLF